MRHAECYIKDYPRPQFVRKSWINLNGEWDFRFDFENKGETENYYKGFDNALKINVPFSYQTVLSKINRDERCDNIWYSRILAIEKEKDFRYILHLEGCDYIGKVWINGEYNGFHKGGYARADFDITSSLKSGNNTVVIKAEDSYSCEQPRGKQRWKDKNYDCWYTDTNGLWKTVWIEKVYKTSIGKITATPLYNENAVAFEVESEGSLQNAELNIKISFDGNIVSENSYKIINSYFKTITDIRSEIPDNFKVRLWTNSDPRFYDVEYVMKENGKEVDKVGSYFAVVDYKTENDVILQNDSPFYLKMMLDQGYWKDSGLTPPDEEAIRKDVELTVEAGFNGIRKHQKLEDERFYYYCDMLGISVWCEMPSFYNFTEKSEKAFIGEWAEIISEVKNHPCIMAWVPINESWGVFRVHSNKKQQDFAKTLYYMTKALDGRFVISNDGWDHTVSDIVTVHNYATYGKELAEIYGNPENALNNKKTAGSAWRQIFAENSEYKGQPLILSEFAGIAFTDSGIDSWGYGDKVENKEAFINRFASLVNSVLDNPHFSGYCVTQITDVFQEVNGLMTMDRKWKIDVGTLKKINEGKYIL